MEVIEFDAEDVILSSGENPYGINGDTTMIGIPFN